MLYLTRISDTGTCHAILIAYYLTPDIITGGAGCRSKISRVSLFQRFRNTGVQEYQMFSSSIIIMSSPRKGVNQESGDDIHVSGDSMSSMRCQISDVR